MKRKAIILTTRPDTEEMEELIFALGADLLGRVLQKRPHPDPQLFLGSGKTEEARDLLRAAQADLVIINGSLKPIQIFNHMRFFEENGGGPVEVYDRTRLILEIFRERAQSPEARLQVELAQLHYEMPLVKEAIHAQKRGERQAPMFGGGEYEVNQYHDMMKKRMSRIRRELEKMRHERGVRRKHRRRGGFHLVSLAGYTNAGKSSLLRAMSEQDALIENRYFSTLSTKTARARSDRREILVTDTVGFIEDLPPWMVEAFHSTLEEIALADVILLVLDASDPADEMARRLRSSLRILWEFHGVADNRGALSFDRADADHAVAAGLAGSSDDALRTVPSRHEETRLRLPTGAHAPSADAGGARAAGADPDASGADVSSAHALRAEGSAPQGPGSTARAPGASGTDGAEERPPGDPKRAGGDAWSTPKSSSTAPGAASRILVPMRRGLAPILVALNKVDRVPPDELAQKRALLEAEGLLDHAMTVTVSAKTGDGLQDLYDSLYGLIPDYDEYEIALPPSPEGESLIAWIHDHADVLDLTRGNEVHLHFEAKRSLRPTLQERLAAVGATPLREARRETTLAPEAAGEAVDDAAVDAGAAADEPGAAETAESDSGVSDGVNEDVAGQPPRGPRAGTE